MPLSPRTLRPANNFTPRSITGLALWLDASDASSLYTTDAGAVTAVSAPTEIAGCVLWLDGADSSSTGMTLNGSLVETWKDKSNSGNNVTASGGLRPTLTSNALNGRSVLTFGGSQGLTGNLASSISTNAYSVFVVCRISGAITNGRVFSTAGASNDFGSGSVIPCVSNAGTLSAFAGTQGANVSSVTGFASYGVFAGVLSSNLVANSAGGMSVASAAATLSTAVTRLGVGVAAQGGAGFNTCDIAEIIVYPTALSTAVRARVEAYLAAKWGISGVHAPATATSDPVGAWLDKSGNARHATQSTAGSRPLVGSIASGRGLVFDSNDSLLSLASIADIIGAPASSPATTIAFIALNSSGAAGFTMGANDAANGRLLVSNSFDAAGASFFDVAGASGGRLSYTLPASSQTTASVYIMQRNGASMIVRRNGATIATKADASQTYSATTARLALGQAIGLSGFAGTCASVLCYPSALTATQYQRIERYLAARWGITLAPQVTNADAQDFINRVYANGGTVSSSTAAAVNAFCDAIDAAAIRDRFYRLNLFCGGTSGTTAGLAACLVPLYRGPSLGGTQYGNTTDTNVGPFAVGDYAETGASGGLKGNGSTKSLATGLLVDLFTASNSHMSVGLVTAESASGFKSLMGANISLNTWELYARRSAGSGIASACFGSATAESNRFGNDVVAATLAAGHIIASYPAMYRNGTAAGTTASSNGTVGSVAVSVFAQNIGGTVGSHTDARLSSYSIGLGMTASQAAAFSTAHAAFNAALGRA